MFTTAANHHNSSHCSKGKCTPASPWNGVSFAVSGVCVVFTGMWNDVLQWLYERSRLKEVAHPALTGRGLGSENKFKFIRKVFYREQMLGLGVLLCAGALFGACVMELDLVAADLTSKKQAECGNGENGSIKLADLDMEQGMWLGRPLPQKWN